MLLLIHPPVMKPCEPPAGIAKIGGVLNHFGVRVKLLDANIEGLIHISELDWQLVENPAEVVKVGEIVKAQIIDISNNQVFLSLKALKQNPWEEIEKQYKNYRHKIYKYYI